MITIEELYNLYKECSGICTDTRKSVEGSLFFALKGDRFDGNDYAVKALEAGAKYAVVDRFTLDGVTYGKTRKCLLVENVLQTLQQLAAYHRSQFDIPVLGITGTNGKTTTKELISSVLGRKYNVLFTQGNLNNDIGVPLTLLNISSRTQFAVIEMGASHPGDIARLVKITDPTCGVVTNVGKAHLQGFGSFEGIIRTKGELYDYLRQKGGVTFYNSDSPHLCKMVKSRPGLVARSYGTSVMNATVEKPTPENPYLTLNMAERGVISTKLTGTYNADNVLCALFVGEYFGVNTKKIISAIESYDPSNSRSQFVRTNENSLIVDAYNANPTSMAEALSSFREIEFPEKTIILGDMLELGDSSAEEHRIILQSAVDVTPSIITVGNEFARATSELQLTTVRNFPTVEALKDSLVYAPLKGRTILIKGSNGTHLQDIVESL